MYAKFISEIEIEFPPKNKGSIINYDKNVELLIQDGYKEFIEAHKEPGKAYAITYQETETQIFEIAVEIPEPTPEEILANAKKERKQEASDKAKYFIESGEALYEFKKNKHIEATDGNIGKFTAYALAFITGQLQPTDTVVWNTKEDETVELNQQQVLQILIGLGQIQAYVWTVRYPEFLEEIDKAKTVEEVNAIIIDYTIVGE